MKCCYPFFIFILSGLILTSARGEESPKLSSDKDLVCNNPYTYFIKSGSKISDKDIFENCTDLQKFIRSAPADSIDLVFASESLGHPASSMGHSFLKISGKNDKGIDVEHSISFFTRIDDVGFPVLIIQSFLIGKEGYYTLAPYSETKNYYLFQESRSLWEYRLKLSETERVKIHYLLYELKNKKLKYFFHVNNCATLIQDVFKRTISEFKTTSQLWVTPLDIVRSLKRNGRIESKRFLPTNRWILSELLKSKALNSESLSLIKKKNFKDLALSTDNKKSFLTYKISDSFNNYIFESNKINEINWRNNLLIIDEKFKDIKDQHHIDLSNYYGPESIQPDSQVSLGMLDLNGSKNVLFTFLPVSHRLEDLIAGYVNESEIKLGEFSIIKNAESDKLRLYHLDLFSMKTLPTNNPLVTEWSSQFLVSYRYTYNFDSSFTASPQVLVGVGKTYSLFNDIDIYGLVNGEVLFDKKDNLISGTELGLILRGIFNTKILLNYNLRTNFEQSIHLVTANTSFNFNYWSIVGGYQKAYINDDQFDIFEIKIKYFF